jgi:hypothetical protein
MAWLEYWLAHDCAAAPYLGGAAAAGDESAGTIQVLPGATPVAPCP